MYSALDAGVFETFALLIHLKSEFLEQVKAAQAGLKLFTSAATSIFFTF